MDGQQLCGGHSGLKQITPEVTALANKHRAEAEGKIGTNYTTWAPVGYTTQVVAGVNYWIKVNCGTEVVHLKIYQNLSQETQLTEANGGKGPNDAFY